MQDTLGSDNIRQPSGRSTATRLIVWALIVVILAAGAFFFTNHFIVRWPIEGDSMTPTLLDGDYVLLFRTKRVRRDNVIIFYHTPADQHYVKRVVGVPGDTIETVYDEENLCYHLYRNGELLSESRTNEPMRASGGWTEGAVTVPEGKYYVLGDNRNHSFDSQDGYFVDPDEIKGIVFLRISQSVFTIVK